MCFRGIKMKDLQTVLDALKNSIGLVYEAVERYGGLSRKKSYVDGFAELIASHKEAIEIVKQMMQAEPVAWLYVPCVEDSDRMGIPPEFNVTTAHVAKPVPEGRDTVQPLYTAPQAVPSWLPISSVPHSADKVLAFSESGNVKIETGYRLVNLLHASKVEGDNCNYTHWMPLPAAPRGAV
jgi:Protein of unknown function (DUF551)